MGVKRRHSEQPRTRVHLAELRLDHVRPSDVGILLCCILSLLAAPLWGSASRLSDPPGTSRLDIWL